MATVATITTTSGWLIVTTDDCLATSPTGIVARTAAVVAKFVASSRRPSPEPGMPCRSSLQRKKSRVSCLMRPIGGKKEGNGPHGRADTRDR